MLPSAVVSINPEEELSVTITDGLGRHVLSAQLQPWDGPQPFDLITWNCSVHDQSVTIAGVGTVLETRSVDPLGFVTKTRTDGGGRTVESYDQENFKTNFTHDANGNTLSVRDPNGVGYDAVFDSLNRQTSQTDTFGVSTSQLFDKEGNVTKQFDGKGNFTTFAIDALNRRKTVTNHRTFDSFGNLTAESQSTVDEIFAYTGKFFDEVTKLSNHLNRWFDPGLGKWVSEDPIGFRGMDTNLARYVSNSVPISVDSNGLEVAASAFSTTHHLVGPEAIELLGASLPSLTNLLGTGSGHNHQQPNEQNSDDKSDKIRSEFALSLLPNMTNGDGNPFFTFLTMRII